MSRVESPLPLASAETLLFLAVVANLICDVQESHPRLL